MVGDVKNWLKKFIVIHNLLGKSQRQKFQSGGFYYYGGLRATLTKALPYIKEPGRALDIGAGFGNESKELLGRGFSVDATEVNDQAVAYLKKLARKRSRLVVYNIGLPEIPNTRYDLIICEMVLHFLNKANTYASINSIKAATKRGGLNVISSYIETSSIRNDERLRGYYKYLLRPLELKRLYRDWEIIYYEEKANAMGHKSARMIARKN